MALINLIVQPIGLKALTVAALVYKYCTRIRSLALSTIFKSMSMVLVMRGSYGRVQSIPFGLIFKLSNLASPEEAKTIRFIAEHTKIPLPHVILSATGFWKHYMLMKRVDGELLADTWSRLSPEQRYTVIKQLRAIVEKLRSIPVPDPPHISALDDAPCLDGRVGGSKTFGPFKTVTEFNEHVINISAYYDERNIDSIRKQMPDDSRIFFTHGDLAPRNIFVQGDKVVAIIDWENAGWYPEHWEYVKAKYCHMMDNSWDQAIRDMMPEDYEREWKLDKDLSDRIVGAL